jgi:hypothetical protein
MKVNVLDPVLSERSGHHFDYDHKLIRHLVEAGHEVHTYGAAKMDDDAVADLSALGPVTPLLGNFRYSSPEHYDAYAGELVLFQRASAVLAQQLRAAAEADVWIWPTMRSQYLNACTLRGVKGVVVGCIHDDPGIAAHTLAAMLWRFAFVSAHQANMRFTVGTIEPELRQRFLPIAPDQRFPLIPHPVDGPPIAEPKAALKRIGFFGYQRPEKGSSLMTELIERLVAEGYLVTLHNTNRSYEGPAHPQVELLGFVEDIAEPIAACDLVVLPYDIARYRTTGSGILVQCLALGIPVTGPAGTLPGNTIGQAGVGPLFDALTADAIHAAIEAAEQNYATFARQAHQYARKFVQHNGAAKFAEAFLAAAR